MREYEVCIEMNDTYLVDAETPEEAMKIAKGLLFDNISAGGAEYMIDYITVTEKNKR